MNSILFQPISEAIAAIQAGRLVIVVDDEDRENEGDFVCAAETITPETVDFLLSHGRGMLCVPVGSEIIERLRLSPMVERGSNTSPTQTPFLVMIDHRSSGTGISAENRARTIRAIADPNSRPEDFVQPGHIPPLAARNGGVLRRAGHTEATVDLVRLAGMQPAGVLVEILSREDCGMADRTQLQLLSQEFGIPMISIEELIRYRRTREQIVRREVETPLPTRYGPVRLIAYSVEYEDLAPLAIVAGDLKSVAAPLVRMHSSCFATDLLASLRRGTDQLHFAMQMIVDEGVGAIVYLPQEGKSVRLARFFDVEASAKHDRLRSPVNSSCGCNADIRDRMIGLQILKDLGLNRIRLLTNNPEKFEAFPYVAMGIEIVDQLPIMTPAQSNLCLACHAATEVQT